MVCLQRVTKASVSVGGAIVGAIERGVVLYVAVDRSDIGDDGALVREPIARLAERVPRLRIFPGAESHFAESLLDVGGAALCISQFTLPGRTAKGTRPSFERAAGPADGQAGYEYFVECLGQHIPVATGRFAADMTIESVLDGPITLWLGSAGAEAPWVR